MGGSNNAACCGCAEVVHLALVHRAFTGYIEIQARHLFFYFFESRSDPDKDDVVFWTNGGPGCSSAVGLFMEHGESAAPPFSLVYVNIFRFQGPCRVHSVDNVTFNPHSWNEHANVLYIDQPIGVGFSYAEHGETVVRNEARIRALR